MTSFCAHSIAVELIIISEKYEQDGVVVTLEWAEDNSLYSYNVSVSPWLEVMLIGRVKSSTESTL